MNAFSDLAERQISAPRKARLRAAETRTAKKLEQNNRQHQMWRRWRRGRIKALLAGPHRADTRALIKFLQRMTLDSAGELIDFASPWRKADLDTRFLVLGLIDVAIIKLREARGLVSIDDALPGEPLTIFQIVRDSLR
jgi:hypothetical protein